MAAEEKTRRRWLEFSIRDLVLSTAIVALVIGWYLDHARLVGSEGFRVGNGVLNMVRRMSEEVTADPFPLEFREPFVKRPFVCVLSRTNY